MQVAQTVKGTVHILNASNKVKVRSMKSFLGLLSFSVLNSFWPSTCDNSARMVMLVQLRLYRNADFASLDMLQELLYRRTIGQPCEQL